MNKNPQDEKEVKQDFEAIWKKCMSDKIGLAEDFEVTDDLNNLKKDFKTHSKKTHIRNLVFPQGFRDLKLDTDAQEKEAAKFFSSLVMSAAIKSFFLIP